MGHWSKACRMKNRETDHKQKIHRISDTDEGFVQTNNDHCDHDDSRSVEFNSLNTFPDPKAPHLRPLSFSERHDSSIHLVEAEVDSGAGCNTFSLYLYRKIFGAAPLEPPSVVNKAFGYQPVRNLGCKVLFLHIGKQILQKKFQVCDVKKNPIIGRDLSAEMGYITFPPITEPHLSSRPTIQKIYTISTKAETTENITDVKRPVVQKQTKNQRLNTQQDDSREAMLSAKHTSQKYYNRHAKEREQLSELQHVWYKKDPVVHWQRGSVVQVADTPKSYVVQDDSGARYQRNSRHVRSATVPTDSEDPSDATPLV
ncbi:hypothetical protein CAPTEDRAFT_185405 [Capitella teleta]|uniref:Uncharacterized protein n=1 Tax=Capitella teleta TaxID=283909 RepID=R7T800_CAPTE|nr:hypothetical protein CAPTEDRAFT_185405 [Capitella teleta]|eukprot:ELT89774.1 hypothetical protein CAPTEDRAFT_185405 [Capitella teleta]